MSYRLHNIFVHIIIISACGIIKYKQYVGG